jgi:hypothetical protein
MFLHLGKGLGHSWYGWRNTECKELFVDIIPRDRETRDDYEWYGKNCSVFAYSYF